MTGPNNIKHPHTNNQSKRRQVAVTDPPNKRYNYLLLKAFESSSPHRSPDRRCRCWGRTWCPDRCAPGCRSQSFRCRRSCSFSTRTHAPGSSRGEPIYSNSTRKFPQNTTTNLNIHVNLNNSTLIQIFFVKNDEFFIEKFSMILNFTLILNTTI